MCGQVIVGGEVVAWGLRGKRQCETDLSDFGARRKGALVGGRCALIVKACRIAYIPHCAARFGSQLEVECFIKK